MSKKGKKTRRYRSRLIAEASLRIAPIAVAIAFAGHWAFNNIDELRDFNYDDLSRFLNYDRAIEQNDRLDADEEKNQGALEVKGTEEEVTQEEPNEEVASEGVTNPIPFPDIIPEVDYERTSSELYEMGIELPPVDWEYTNEVNEEANAWIYIPGVGPDNGINLPVVQGEDNDYYLNHDIYGNEDDRGTLFIDYRNNPMDSGTQELSDVTVIYGHNRKSGAMFAPICNYKTQKFYDRHPYGVIIAENGDVYKIDFFAGVIVDGSNSLNVYASDFIDESQFNAYFDNIVSNSTFESDCKVQFGDKIILLQTCSYEYDGAKYLLYGRLTKQLINEQEVQSTLGR
ncbi:MAG: class B sortase [Bacilli bacterium]|nr:class B sortase [Bacilli bacterium]